MATKTDIARRVFNHTFKLDPIVRSLGKQREPQRSGEAYLGPPQHIETLADLGKASLTLALLDERPATNDERGPGPEREAVLVREIGRPGGHPRSLPPLAVEHV